MGEQRGNNWDNYYNIINKIYLKQQEQQKAINCNVDREQTLYEINPFKFTVQHMVNIYFNFIFLRFYLFIFRERGREK